MKKILTEDELLILLKDNEKFWKIKDLVLSLDNYKEKIKNNNLKVYEIIRTKWINLPEKKDFTSDENKFIINYLLYLQKTY